MGGFVSVLIVDFYTRDRTMKLVRDLSDDDSVREILIVDNTGDQVYQEGWQCEGNTRVVLSPVPAGYGSGLNRGAREVDGSTHLLLANSDLRVTSGTVGRLVQALESRCLGAVGATILGEDGQPQADSCGRFPDVWTGGDGPDWITGACILTPKRVFDELGGFDERFHMYWEDVDFCRRLYERGFRVAVDEALVVQHRSGGSTDSGSARYAMARKGRQRYLAKWGRSSLRRHIIGVTSFGKLLVLRTVDVVVHRRGKRSA